MHRSQLLAQLETATARDLPAGVPLDAETESQRESWLAFTQLLAAAEEPLDADGIARHLEARPAPHHAQEHSVRQRQNARSRPALAAAAVVASAVVASAAVAASLLVAAVLRPLWSPADAKPASNTQVVAETPIAPPPETLAGSTDIAWDDSFDDQLTLADRQLDVLAQSWRGDDVLYYSLQQQMRELEAELADGSL